MTPALASSPAPASAAIPIVDPTSARRPVEPIHVQAPNVTYTRDHITSTYVHNKTEVTKGEDGSYRVRPTEHVYEFKTERKVPKTGYVHFAEDLESLIMRVFQPDARWFWR